jgi:hypothetical protein
MAERPAITYEQALKRPMFPGTFRLGMADHNVGDCVPALNSASRRYIDTYYPSRAFHIPKTPAGAKERTRMGFVVAGTDRQIDRAVKEQIIYLNGLKEGLSVERFTPDAIHKKTLVVPYINTSRKEQEIRASGAEVYGLPGVMTDLLKNKAESHRLVTEFDSDTFQVVKGYEIIDVGTVAESGERFLSEIEAGYTELGLYDAYNNANAIGVVYRSATSDGGYGNCVVKKTGNEWTVSYDGEKEATVSFSTYQEAFKYAQDYLLSLTDQTVERRIVMSRLIDKVDSPGMSLIIQDDHIISLGWNGQMQHDGMTACVETANYIPRKGYEEYCEKIQKEFGQIMIDGYEQFLRFLAEKNGIKFANIRGIINIDFMIPTELEFERQRRSGEKRHLPVAEFNPRFSEYTNPLIGGTLLSDVEQTPQELIRIAERGVHTFAKYPLPVGVDPGKVREELGKRYHNNKLEEGMVVVLIAPDLHSFETHDGKPVQPLMGLVIYGNEEEGKKAIKAAIDKVRKEQQPQPVFSPLDTAYIM